MKKYKISFILAIIMFIFAGCNVKDSAPEPVRALYDGEIYMYYVNEEKTELIPVPYMPGKSENIQAITSEIIRQLGTGNDGTDEQNESNYLISIPNGVVYKFCFMEDSGRMIVSFEANYQVLPKDVVVLMKASITKTLLQLEGIRSVYFKIRDTGNLIEEIIIEEEYDEDSFAMNFDGDYGYVQTGSITLYFTDEAGEILIPFKKTVEISNNMSLESIVLDTLITGSSMEGYRSTLPEGTLIRNISVKDGICYVDFNAAFNENNELRNDIVVYSVVNSLAELPTVSKVQFLIEGNKQAFYRETLAFDGLFERNLDLLERPKERIAE